MNTYPPGVICKGWDENIIDCYSVYYFNLIEVKDSCEDGQIRLVDGTKPSEGRLEICLNNLWGSVCSVEWTVLDANIVANNWDTQKLVGSFDQVCCYVYYYDNTK